MEAKFGLRTCGSKPSESESRGSMDLAGSTGKGNGTLNQRNGCFKCGGNNFQRDCIHHVTQRQNGASRGPSVLAATAAHGGRKIPRNENLSVCIWSGQSSKTGPFDEKAKKHRKLHEHSTLTILVLTIAAVLMSAMIAGAQLDGTKVGTNHRSILQAHFLSEVSILKW